jgi:Arylsulfotransferase (ASST)
MIIFKYIGVGLLLFLFLACDDDKSSSSNNLNNTNNVNNTNNTNANNVNNINNASTNNGQFVEELNPDWTVGLKQYSEGSYDGYTLIAPLGSTSTWLIDNRGRIVHQWESQRTPGNVVYLTEDGTLLRTESIGEVENSIFTAGGAGGVVSLYDWDSNLIWEYEVSSDIELSHHDVQLLPNGNVLMIVWDLKTEAEAVAAGRDPSTIAQGTVWSEKIIEVHPTGSQSGEIVWQWSVWDHLVQDFDETKENYNDVASHRELLNLNYTSGPNPNSDWLHINAVHYNQEFDLIILSCHNTSELYVIDHSTTQEEASSHTGGHYGKGGDILYRWGNPEVYGAEGVRQLYVQHDIQWINPGLPGEGNVLVFNNGTRRDGGNYSTVDELILPWDNQGVFSNENNEMWGPETFTWSYAAPVPEDFYSGAISGAQRLPNGNTLICSGTQGNIFEVTIDGTMVWNYINPVTRTIIVTQGDQIPSGPNGDTSNSIFRAYRYPLDYAAFNERTLTPGDYIEGQ